MLANISHDIKTPLTVIPGYLEIIGMENKDNETLQKVEVKARQGMELINQFFTLAKLEAGDMNIIEITKVNINELCRENVLGFYGLLIQIDFNMENFSFYVQLFLKSVVAVSISFIALFIGLKMKLSMATIITSLLLVLLTQANIGDFLLAGNLVFPVILTVISFVFALLSIITIENFTLPCYTKQNSSDYAKRHRCPINWLTMAFHYIIYICIRAWLELYLPRVF